MLTARAHNRQQAAGRTLSYKVLVSCLGLLLYATTGFAASAPYIPEHDDDILLRLPESKAGLTTVREDKSLDRVEKAARFLEVAYQYNDASAFGYARSQLAPWWNMPAPDTRTGLLIATIQQHNHEFTAAIDTLTRLLRRNSAASGARLMRAQVFIATGAYDKARRDCLALSLQTNSPLAVNCLAQVGSLTGRAANSYMALEELLAASPAMPGNERLELIITQATIAHRLNQPVAAQSHYQQALIQAPNNLYVLNHYADFLLEQGRVAEIPELLARLPESQLSQELMVKKILGLQVTDPAAAVRQSNRLDAIFADSEIRHDAVPHKAIAVFALAVRSQPENALASARANWQVQKAPDDALLLLRAAIAANNRSVTADIADWRQRHQLEDYRITALLKESDL